LQIEFGGAFFRNFFQFISEGFEATKDFVSSSFGSLAGKIKVFALKANLAMAEIPIIGRALDKESISANLKVAEDELTESQNRMLKSMSDFGKAVDLVSRTGILKTMVDMRFEQQETTALRTGGGEEAAKPTTVDDTEETDEDKEKEKEKQKATAGFFSMMQLDKIKSIKDTNAKIRKLRADDLADLIATEDAKNAVRNAGLDAISQGFNILAGLSEESKELQAASIIAENATGIAKNIINTNAANARLTLEGGLAAPALITANNIRMGIGIASSVAAAAKGLSQLGKSGGADRGDGSRSSESNQAPAFNLVDGTESSSIQNSIQNQGSTPIKAYVVSGEVESQSSLNRQIKDSSSI